MDATEFGIWMKRLKLLYPRCDAWIEGLDMKIRTETAAEWERAFHDVEFVDATEALTDIHTGEAEAFNQWEYGTWVGHVRKLANAKRAQRYDATHRHTRATMQKPSGGVNLGGIYRQIVEIKGAGGDVMGAIKRLLPIREDGPRLKCWRCQDSGFVTVWHVVTMRAIANGEEITPRLCKTMATICNCQLGRLRVSPQNAKRQTWTEGHVFDSDKHCLYGGGDLDDLREFVANYERRQMESKPNYSPALAAYGR